MTSTAPSCCPPGSWPSLAKTSNDTSKPPKGEVLEVEGDLSIYYSAPPEGTAVKGSIVVFQDVYSVPVFKPDDEKFASFGRIEEICDTLAEQGYAVVLPNLFGDKPYNVAISPPTAEDSWTSQNVFAPPGGVEWFQSFHYDKMKPIAVAAATFLKSKVPPGTKMGALGFCYGSWCMTKASSQGDVAFDCLVACHPATILEGAVFGGNEVDLLKSAKAPMRFLVAKNDSDVFQGEGKEALEKGGGDVVHFPDMVHGWVSRGDASEENVQRDVSKAMDLILDFFAKKL